MKQAPIADWAQQETAGADCGDARLERRLGVLLTALGEALGVSIPQACHGGHAEIAAAYRFFDNPGATVPNILAAHVGQTLRRMGQHPTVLLIQDTTEVDMSQPHREVKGAGPLDDSPRQGARLHLMHAFTPGGTPLGSVWQKILVRKPGVRKASAQSRHARQGIDIGDKESVRWIEGLQQADALAREHAGQRLICLADSEADIYEYLSAVPAPLGSAEAEAGPRAHWIVRACQNRAVQQEPEGSEAAADRLWAACAAAPVLWSSTLQVRGRHSKLAADKRARRQPRADREATVSVRALQQVSLRPPYRKGRKLDAVRVNAVLVREENPPQDEVPVEWLLVTSLPVQEAAQVQQVVEAYSRRFMIEVFFRVLKSGCRVEERRFTHAQRHLSHLAVALIVAWRVLMLSRLAQEEPQQAASTYFAAAEWRAAWSVIHRGRPLPPQAPDLGETIRMVAKLGGWIERRGKYASPPGAQTLSQGLQRLRDLAAAWETFGPHTCV